MTKSNQATKQEWMSDAFWQQPTFDPTETGEAGDQGIYLAVGLALSCWEELEDRLADMFDLFGTEQGGKITNHSYQMGRHMFGIMESSSTRIRMLQVAASLYFGHWWSHKPVSDPYTKLFEAVMHASHRRNEIAHGRATQAEVHRGEGLSKRSGFFLTSPRYAIKRNEPYYGGKWHPDDVLGGIDRSKYRYRMKDIIVFSEKFRLLAAKMLELLIEAAHGEHKIPKIVERLLSEGKLRQA